MNRLWLVCMLVLPGFVSAHAAGDAESGKRLYMQYCTACHSIDVSLAGPMHRGVYGRRAGTVPDYDYSPALKRARIIWNERTLDQWLTNPEKFVPGQKMGVSVPNAQHRADLIAYLKAQTPRR